MLPLILSRTVRDPLPEIRGFDTDIGAFIESSVVTSKTGLMARLIVKDSITSGGALAPGQTLRLGGFTMTAHSAAKPMMTSRVIENRLLVDSEHFKRMDPMELSSLNEFLDHIAALGVATDYDQIELKPDQREIKSPPITHQVVVIEERNNNSPSILRTNYVRISVLEELDARP